MWLCVKFKIVFVLGLQSLTYGNFERPRHADEPWSYMYMKQQLMSGSSLMSLNKYKSSFAISP